MIINTEELDIEVLKEKNGTSTIIINGKKRVGNCSVAFSHGKANSETFTPVDIKTGLYLYAFTNGQSPIGKWGPIIDFRK